MYTVLLGRLDGNQKRGDYMAINLKDWWVSLRKPKQEKNTIVWPKRTQDIPVERSRDPEGLSEVMQRNRRAQRAGKILRGEK